MYFAMIKSQSHVTVMFNFTKKNINNGWTKKDISVRKVAIFELFR